MRRANVSWLSFSALMALVLAMPMTARAQGAQAGAALKAESLVGIYQGTATHSAGGVSLPLTMTLKFDKDTFAGTVETGGTQGSIPITGGSFTGGRLVLTFAMIGVPATLTCTVTDPSRLEGSWVAGDATGTVALTRLAPDAAKALADKAAAAPPAAAPGAKPAANPNDPITGQWDGVTGNSDMQLPFTMTLKLDGEKVTGDISSEQGGAPLSAGSWKNGALNLSFEFGGMGTVTMVASLQEGKLVGSLDVGGQMQMQWAAVRK